MNQKEFELIGTAFNNHRKQFGGRTDSVWFLILAELIYEIEREYSNFDRVKLYKFMNLSVHDVQQIPIL